ncbi:phosphatases II [Wallemia mellicola]|nr:phosphatases II [Wallemia mellicola]
MSEDFQRALAERFGPNHTSVVTQPTLDLEKPDPFSPPVFNRSQTQASPMKSNRTSLTPQFQNLGKSNYVSPNRGDQALYTGSPSKDNDLNEFEKAIGSSDKLKRRTSLSRDAHTAGLTDKGPAFKKASPSPSPAQLGRPPPFNLKAPPMPRQATFSAPSTSQGTVDIRHAELHKLIEAIRQDPEIVKKEILVIDLRSYGSYCQTRVPGAVSVCLPSTLLRRPVFTLDKIINMISDPSDKAKLEGYERAKTIVAYDNDTSYVGEGISGNSAALLGVFKKFRDAGATASLEYIQGGFVAYSRAEGAPIEDTPKSTGNGPSDGKTENTFVQPRHLPITAFQGISTTTNKSSPRHGQINTSKFAANPFFDSVRQNRELANGMSQERIPMNISDDVKTNSYKLPQFLKRIVDMSEKDASDELAHQFYRLEVSEQKRMMEVFEWLSNNSQTLDNKGNQSASLGSKERDNTFVHGKERKIDRYSIGAGVELGHKNRYRNIYPFEHTRVKLKSPEIDGNDYVNASHVLPGIGYYGNDGLAPTPLYANPAPPAAAGKSDISNKTRNARKDLMHHTKRYIATQGPMESTLNDFWQVCWEQDVNIIIMLTKQREGGLDKCCRYWSDRKVGDIEISLIKMEGDEGDEKVKGPSKNSYVGEDSSTETASKEKFETSFVRRDLRLRNLKLNQEKTISQFQYLGWPDFDIPSQPDALLPLISTVNKLYDWNRGPIVVHCSAGVGRTGSYVALDTMLDLLREERRKPKSGDSELDEMQVDTTMRSDMTETDPGMRKDTKESVTMDEHDDVNMEVERQTTSRDIGQKDDFPFGPPSPPENLRRKLSSMSSQASGISDGEDVGQKLKWSNLEGKREEHNNCQIVEGLHEPVCDVIEDLREQRMSMVSTLRQYVYVHSAVIAGVMNEIENEK